MANRPSIKVLLITIALVGCLMPHRAALALTAEEYFADGNRLFRDDLYWAALLRYRQAEEEGLSSPLLYYNRGIAHYRAGQHIRARESLKRALEDSSLRPVAHYNLGLNAYQLGETEEALTWFRLARDQNRDETIQLYALTAISRIQNAQAIPDEFDERVADRSQPRELGNLELHAQVSFGSDSNVFRSPDQPYFDFADPDIPLVVPEVKSGVFIPVRLGAKYNINTFDFEGFFVSYRFSGRFYQDTNLENGNEFQHEAAFGNEYRREEDGRERAVYSAFKVAQHDEVYFDPDDGGVRDVDGVDIGERMNYLRFGPELTLRQSHERLTVGAKIKGQLWDYEEQVVVPEYDHEFFQLSVYGQYKYTPWSLFRFTLDAYTRRFSDRPAFDLDGVQRIGNPTIHYNYLTAEFTARQRILDNLWIGFDIERTGRFDQHVGYFDYTRDGVSVQLHWAPGERFNLEANGRYRVYKYPNAFAFHEPLAGFRTQETAEVGLVGMYQMKRNLSLVAEVKYRDTVSNDTRIQYDRTQFSFGVRWDQ